MDARCVGTLYNPGNFGFIFNSHCPRTTGRITNINRPLEWRDLLYDPRMYRFGGLVWLHAILEPPVAHIECHKV